MVLRLAARVELDDMDFDVIYPDTEPDEEKIAKLTGIVQLVSHALESSESSNPCAPMFMKSEHGVIGYCQVDGYVMICEGDTERETEDALRALLNSPTANAVELEENLERVVNKTGKEIGDLWR
ncbi:MAG: hypothetical protein GF309_01250 [Candidatus Lokiarchaeota archaeon]|jgi:hypothetical protein|nr:hypothetical protein [Candidatus Lokiarchaeota archaeon]